MEEEKAKEKGKEVCVKEKVEQKAMVGVGQEVYPAPLHSHEEVVRDPAIFMQALRYFHSTMGTKFTIPVIGGKDLDLHLLYVEVTQRGGVEKVIVEKKWKEVTAMFRFPPSTTSASFVLRKYYLSLLYHFEKVYFFRTQGPGPSSRVMHLLKRKLIWLRVVLAATLQTKTPPSKLDLNLIISDSTTQRPWNGKRAHPESQNNGEADIYLPSFKKGPYNFSMTGTIDGKFECGYIVTVKIGSEIMRGVFFNTKQHPSAPPSLTAEAPNGAIATQATATGKRCKQRWGQRHRDPTHPRPKRSAYNFFFAKKYSKLRALYPHQDKEFSKMIGAAWNKLSEEERSVYKDWGLEDKERYKTEMREYRERPKLILPKEVVMAKTSGKAVVGK